MALFSPAVRFIRYLTIRISKRVQQIQLGTVNDDVNPLLLDRGDHQLWMSINFIITSAQRSFCCCQMCHVHVGLFVMKSPGCCCCCCIKRLIQYRHA